MLRIHLVRHGETDWNAAGRVQGWSDVPLNATGERQAALLAESLRESAIAALVSSDLERARRTAAALAAVLDLPVSIDERLRERHLGALEGVSARAAARGADPVAWVARIIGDPDHLPAEGAETLGGFRARVTAALADLLAEPPAAEFAVVSHGGVVRAALLALTGDEGREVVSRITNCADVVVEHDRRAGRIVEVVEVAPLAPVNVDEGAAGASLR